MKLRLTAAQERELGRLRAAVPHARVVLIGAVAVASHIVLPRDTKDVDLAIDLELVETEKVLAKLGWKQRPRTRQRWTQSDDFIADVVPSASILIEKGSVSFAEGREMNLAGFELVFSEALQADLGGLAVEVASLPTIVFLKMVAWLDRPHERRKDLNDLGTILRKYLEDDDERHWSAQLDGRSFESQGAFLAGRELRLLLGTKHRELVENFFEEVDGPGWLREVAKGIDSPLLSAEAALEAFRLGAEG